LKKEKKPEIVADLHERLAKAKAVFVTDFRGLNVETLNRLRRDLRRGGDEYQVVKKTLFKRASQETALADLTELFIGPCGVTLSYQDPVASAKTLAQFAKDKEGFVFKGGVLEGRPLSGEAVMQLSKMPAREVLLGQVLSSLIAVPSNFVSTLAAVIQTFLLTLKALEEQRAQA
jgi:large subunit ribosomal protein L10